MATVAGNKDIIGTPKKNKATVVDHEVFEPLFACRSQGGKFENEAAAANILCCVAKHFIDYSIHWKILGHRGVVDV